MANKTFIQDVDQLQLAAYRRMTGEERLLIGLGLYEASVRIAREAIRSKFPDADDVTVEEKLRERIRVGYQIQAATQRSPSPSGPLSECVEGGAINENDSVAKSAS